MLIEQIIEFRLRGRGPPGCSCSPTASHFHNKNIQGKSVSELVFTAKNITGGKNSSFKRV